MTPLKSGIENIQEALKGIPASAGIYKMKNAQGDVLYVGKAKNLSKRVASYTQIARLVHRMQRMVSQVSAVEVVTCESEAEALLMEANVVRKLQPKFNVLLKDDKSFPYIFISKNHAYPRIVKFRGAKSEDGYYFGPFASAWIVNETIALIQKAFLLRPCSDNIFANRSRPCLQYQIKRCSAPCVGKIAEQDYTVLIKEVVEFLSGKSREIQEQFKKEMLAASEREDYEEAALYRDRIKALTQLQGEQKIHLNVKDADIVAMHREGDKSCIQVFFFRAGLNFGNRAFFPVHSEDTSDNEIISAFLGRFYQTSMPPAEIIIAQELEGMETIETALSIVAKEKITITVPKRGDKVLALNHASKNAREALIRKLSENASTARSLDAVAESFELDSAPERIEVYDNSHIMGTNQVGAMIVATPEGFAKKHYRKFNIKMSDNGDDYAMMREVLTRRFKRLDEDGEDGWTQPDLVVIDGGPGQLSIAEQVFAELGINDVPVVSIAKGPNRNAGDETFYMPGKEPFKLPKGSPALYYLERLRDEAHRFAIGTHRKKRDKNISVSKLDAIPGIGAKRKLAMLQHFGSAKAVESASIEQLLEIEGINRKVAEVIYNYFR